MKKQSHNKEINSAVQALVKLHGVKSKENIAEGVQACARIWDWRKDNAASFHNFCLEQYVPIGKPKTKLLERLDQLNRTLSGSFMIMRKELRAGLDIADYELTPAEKIFGSFSPSTHLQEDFRAAKIAQLVQLNFGTDSTVPPRSREAWAARRLADWGRENVPASLMALAAQTAADVDQFVSGYNLYIDSIDFGDPEIKFPKGTRLISHWGLRDYMMEIYDEPNAIKKQRAILGLLERVVDGEIPAEMLDDPKVKWNLPKQTLLINGKNVKARGQGPLRWANFQKMWKVMNKVDPFTRYGNMIDTKFLEERELAEDRVKKILTDILSSPAAEEVGVFLKEKFGRPLEPFDLYYKDFGSSANSESQTNSNVDVARKFPNRDALQSAIPEILVKLGFEKEFAKFAGEKIRVDNGRSAGHAWSPYGEHDLQLLRVRVPAEGISEIEFSTFMHELGHAVEGVISSFLMDYGSLWGVPNSAITEAFAFTFQDRADFVLGRPDNRDKQVTTLQRFWEAFEIAGPALTEIEFFHWLYKNPKATPLQMQTAIRKIGDNIWAKYHARIFGDKGYGLMSAYSHILWCDLYLADYPLGYVCAYQIRRFLEGKNLGEEMLRMCKSGSVYPDVWMKNAVGRSIEATPLLRDTAAAARELRARRKAA